MLAYAWHKKNFGGQTWYGSRKDRRDSFKWRFEKLTENCGTAEMG